MRPSLLVALVWCLPFCASAQRDSASSAPQLMIKASIGDLIGMQYSRVFGSAAFRVTPKQYAELGGGLLIPFAIARNKVDWNDLNGYVVEASYRFFAKPLTRTAGQNTWWVSGGIAHQHLEGNMPGDFFRQDSYFQRLNYAVTDRRTGGKISGGVFAMPGKHILVEWGMSFFIFHRQWAFSELPADVVFFKNGSPHWSYNPEPKSRTEMRGAMILKLGWLFY